MGTLVVFTAIQDQVKPVDRLGNWAQLYKDGGDIQRFIESQFKDVERIKSLINNREGYKKGKLIWKILKSCRYVWPDFLLV